MGTISQTWVLNQTANDVVGVSRGMLAAATTDNVQMLALLACESFGATLAMSPETCTKVELLCSQIHKSAVLNFIKAQIGYRHGDCGWQLAHTEAGIRFLGLAACLTTIGHWTAAQSLHDMILETATDKTLIPSALQVKQLIQVLDYRLAKSGFTESILGWSLWISNCPTFANRDAPRISDWDKAPSRKAVGELVRGVRSLGRIGEQGEKDKLLITTPTNQAAWIVAFLKWCLGAPPSIGLQDGTALLTEPTSQVLVTLDETQDNVISISQVKETGEITDLVRPFTGLDTYKGMVSTRVFMQKLLHDLFGSEQSLPYRACLQALPYACSQVTSRLRRQRYGYLTTQDERIPIKDEVQDCVTEGSVVATWGQIFPENEKIASALTSSLGLELPAGLTELLEGSLVEDLPLVALAKGAVCRSCTCPKCRNETEVSRTRRRRCEFRLFLQDVSVCVAIILAISLLESRDPDGVLFRFSGPLRERSDPFVESIAGIILGDRGPGPTTIGQREVIRWVVQLVGHGGQLVRERVDSERWIMSSEHGQTVYPQLLETKIVKNHGILSLLCVPGILLWDNEPYVLVSSSPLYSYSSQSDSPSSDEEVGGSDVTPNDEMRQPTDSFPAHRLNWQVTIGESELTLSLVSPDFSSLPGRNPAIVLATASQSLFVECDHDPMAELPPSTNHLYCYTTPANPQPSRERSDVIGIVPCNQNERMRFMALASGKRGVIRCDACLACCITSCRLAGLKFVIC
jgi:hypothetical protein